VTGTAGSGKTTTLAAMIDHINDTRDGHIVTIEDPIEVLHQDKKCIVNQREIGIDTESYADALRHVVRQDPDVILIGEMRDHETVSAALTAAEIGNLVFSTLHTIDATETINRIIDFFPPYQQKQIRLMLASTLKGIISMRLIPSINGGLVPAVEVLVMTGTIREYILDAEQTYKIRDAMDEGDYYGMQTFDQSLLTLYQDGKITIDDAMSMAANAHDFKIKLRQLGITGQQAAQSGIY
jgi:twitching motility protein PilT